MEKEKLMQLAKEAARNAYTPYSHYNVGAVILGRNGKVYTGCNFENASFGATICAERCAVGCMINDGCRKIAAAAVYVSGEHVGTCCGICRQVLAEFADGDIPVYFLCASGETAEYSMTELLPAGFALEPEE